MEEIIKVTDNVEEIMKCNIALDANKIPEDECKRFLMNLNQIIGFGKKMAELFNQDGQYVLKVPKNIREGLDKGIYWFAEKKDGSGPLPDIWGYSDQGRKQIQERLTIDQKFNADGMSNLLQNYAMQQQMAQMTEELKEIHKEIIHIKTGMDNDRMARIEAAFDELKHASVMEDEKFRNDLIIQAINNLSVGSRMIEKELKLKMEDFDPVPKTRFGIWLKMLFGFRNYKEKMDEAADEIDKFFLYYEKSKELLAYSFMITNQNENVKLVYEDYKKGIASMPLEKYCTIKYLHPNLNIEDTWFFNPIEYGEKMSQKIETINISNYDYIDLKVSGRLLKEVV